MNKIEEFQGEYRFLSNFGDCPNGVKFEGIKYPTAEHAYQAAKTNNITDRFGISRLESPGKAKRAGSTVLLRPDWDKIKVHIMRQIVTAKFMQNPDLMAKLLSTKDAELIEGNRWGDTFWGVCNGKGENLLGKILMNIRDILAREWI